MARITAEGIHGGKNVIVFTEDGRQITKQAHEEEKRLTKLREQLTIKDESDASKLESEDEDAYIQRVKDQLKETKQVDDKLAKDKLKEKRLKQKNKLKKKEDVEGSEEQEDDEGVQLASVDSQQEEYEQYSQSDDS